MGEPQHIYNIMTAPSLQINSLFEYTTVEDGFLATELLPVKEDGSLVPLTLMTELGVKVAKHRIRISSAAALSVDNQTLPASNDKYCLSTDCKSHLTWRYAQDGASMLKPWNNRPEIPSIEADIYIHRYRMRVIVAVCTSTSYGNATFLDLAFFPEDMEMISGLHGILGQTAVGHYSGRGLETPVEGKEDDYMIHSNQIFGDDFKFNQYVDNFRMIKLMDGRPFEYEVPSGKFDEVEVMMDALASHVGSSDFAVYSSQICAASPNSAWCQSQAPLVNKKKTRKKTRKSRKRRRRHQTTKT
jgi:hypothetical protein